MPMGVGFDNQLFALAPFDHPERAGADGVPGVALSIGGSRHDAERRKARDEGDPRLRQLQLDRRRIDGARLFQNGQVSQSPGRAGRVVGEGHVLRRQRRSVREHGVFAKAQPPDKPVFRKGPVRRKVADQVQIGVGAQQGRLEKRIAIMAPPHDRVESGVGLSANGQNQGTRFCLGGQHQGQGNGQGGQRTEHAAPHGVKYRVTFHTVVNCGVKHGLACDPRPV